MHVTEAGVQQKRAKGAFYEQLAADFLEAKGYQIVERNFYAPQGEIDLIARDGACLVFVEVRYRTTLRGGHPLETVNAQKQKRIRSAARWYFLKRGLGEDTACRFDVVGILKEELVHVENAFV